MGVCANLHPSQEYGHSDSVVEIHLPNAQQLKIGKLVRVF